MAAIKVPQKVKRQSHLSTLCKHPGASNNGHCGPNRLSPRATMGRTGMHELGIATSILECVQAEAQRHPDGRITKVGVKIGELSGVDRDALQFGFEVLVKDTEWEPLVLDLEFIPRMQRCSKCAYEFR